MPTLPLTQLDERTLAADLDNRTFTLTFAQPVPIKDLLLLLVRGTSLSIVPDPAITGTFIGELKNVTVRQALDLDPAAARPRSTPSTARSSACSGASPRRASSTSTTSRPSARRIDDRRRAATATQLRHGLEPTQDRRLRRSRPRACRRCCPSARTFNVDRKAGLLQVTDFPERLDRVAVYLDAVQDRVHRQVQIDARVIEVELNDEKAIGVDWTRWSPQ